MKGKGERGLRKIMGGKVRECKVTGEVSGKEEMGRSGKQVKGKGEKEMIKLKVRRVKLDRKVRE